MKHKICEKTKKQFHGSDVEEIASFYGIEKDSIVNFAANVNPAGFSEKAAEALKEHTDVISSYPDRQYKGLKASIASYTGADESHILLGSGVTELLSVFTAILSPKDAVLVGPTYSEYEKDLLRLLATVHHVDAVEDNDFKLSPSDIVKAVRFIEKDVSLVILCNPNNPTGEALSADDISILASELEKDNVLLMIDETYAEFSEMTAISLTKSHKNLLVLRGTSKFFATPGLRLGYAVTSNEDLIKEYEKRADPWSINSVAELCGTVMFSDKEYIEKIRTGAKAELKYLTDELNSIPGLYVYDTYSNFILVRLSAPALSSSEMFDALIRQGLMIRDCSTFRGMEERFIRICYMSHEDNVRLVEAIRSL